MADRYTFEVFPIEKFAVKSSTAIKAPKVNNGDYIVFLERMQDCLVMEESMLLQLAVYDEFDRKDANVCLGDCILLVR